MLKLTTLLTVDTCWPTLYITHILINCVQLDDCLIRCDSVLYWCSFPLISGWQRRSRSIRCLFIIWPQCLAPLCWDRRSQRSIRPTSRWPLTSGHMMLWHRSVLAYILIAHSVERTPGVFPSMDISYFTIMGCGLVCLKVWRCTSALIIITVMLMCSVIIPSSWFPYCHNTLTSGEEHSPGHLQCTRVFMCSCVILFIVWVDLKRLFGCWCWLLWFVHDISETEWMAWAKRLNQP